MQITNEYIEKLDSILADGSFVKEISELTDEKAIQAAFASRGVDLDEETAMQIVARVNFVRENHELDEETLEMVNGGKLGGFLGCVVAGACAGAYFGGPYGAVGGAVIGGTAYISGKIVYAIGSLFI